MNLRNFEYFIVLAETMNFTKAAEKLYLTQQTLSGNIKRLEEHYGTKFFERKPRLMLTPAGRHILEYAKKAIKQEEYFVSELADITKTTTAKLNVGITGMRATIFMPKIWEVFHKIFPNITISIREALTNELDELLQKGEIELYIGVNAPKRTGTEIENLSHEKICCVANRKIFEQYFLRDSSNELERNKIISEGISLEELENMPLVVFGKQNYLRNFLDEFFKEKNIHPNIICETSRHDLVLRFCEEGYGIGIIYRMLLHDMLQNRDRSKIYVLPIKNSFPERYSNLVYRKESFKPQYIKKFMEITRGVFRNYCESVDNFIKEEGLSIVLCN